MEEKPVQYEFHGVSEDGSVGLCISASCSYETNQRRKHFCEATLLNRAPQFSRRIRVFTHKKLKERLPPAPPKKLLALSHPCTIQYSLCNGCTLSLEFVFPTPNCT